MRNKKNVESFEQFGKNFQDNLAVIILKDSSFADQMQEVLNFGFFEYKHLQSFVKKIFDYKTKYKTHPSVEALKSIFNSEQNDENEMLYEQVQEFFQNNVLGERKIEDIEYVKDKSLDFCKKQKLKEAMLKSIDLLQKSSFDEISVEMNNALKLGNSNDLGLAYIDDFEKRYEERQRNPISTGWPDIDGITQGGLGQKELGVIIAPPGCHARGTKVIMFNGKVKNVEEVLVGDLLMGPDSKPRRVLNLVRGTDDMYKVTPVKGKSFIVNGKHILSLRRYFWKNSEEKYGNRKIVNVTVEEYLNKSKEFKHISKLYRANCINFEEKKDLLIDSYILGLLIGDGYYYGDGMQISFTNMDEILLETIKDYMLSLGLDLKASIYQKKNNKAKNIVFVKRKGSGRYNKLFKLLERVGIRARGLKEKFIPFDYLVSDEENRLKLLAGLIDTDGYYNKNKGYEIITKFERLRDDILFLCRSLGLSAYSSDKYINMNGKRLKYFRISIFGDCDRIPCKLERKKTEETRKQKKNWLVTGFDIEKTERDEYYGFQLDKDHLYLLDDFTVMHNCGKSFCLVHLTSHAMRQNKNVVYYSMELSDEYVGLRVDSAITEFPLNDLKLFKDLIKEKIKDITGKLVIKEYPTKSISIKSIRNHLEKMEQKGFVPDMIVIDYLDLLKPIAYTKERRFDLESIAEDLRAMAQERRIPIWTASQCRRDSMEKEVITMESIAESFNKVFCADYIMSLSRTIADKNSNQGRFYIAKNRLGIDGIIFNLFVDTSISKIKVLPKQNDDEQLIIETSHENGNVSKNNRERYKALLKSKKKE